MIYFVTGATGFIGKRLVGKLLLRPASVVNILVREVELPRIAEFREYWGVDDARIVPIVGDLSEPNLGVSKTEIRNSRGKSRTFSISPQSTISTPALRHNSAPTSTAPGTPSASQKHLR